MSERPCCKMPARTKEQVFGGLRFQAEGADGITAMLTFTPDKEGPVHVVLRGNMHKRLRYYELRDDDSYEMLFTAYLGVDLYYTLTNPHISGTHLCLHLLFLPTQKCSFWRGIKPSLKRYCFLLR